MCEPIRSEEDEFSFDFVPKKARKDDTQSARSGGGPAFCRRTAYEVERDAKAAAILAQLPPAQDTTTTHSASPQQASTAPMQRTQWESAAGRQPLIRGRGGLSMRHGYSALHEPPTKAQLNRSQNFHLSRNVLLEVDVATKRPMEVAVDSGSMGSCGASQYRSTNRLVTGSGSGRGSRGRSGIGYFGRGSGGRGSNCGRGREGSRGNYGGRYSASAKGDRE